MEAEAPRVKVSFKVGERVRIVDGPFNDFRGTVAEIDMERSKVRVMVNFFGRETPVELDFLQVERRRIVIKLITIRNSFMGQPPGCSSGRVLPIITR